MIAPRIIVSATAADQYGKRTFSAQCNGDEIYTDRFDPRDGFRREKFRKAVVDKVPPCSRVATADELANWNPRDGGIGDAEPFGWIDDAILDAAREADIEAAQHSTTGATWDADDMTSADLANGDFSIRFLIDDVLPVGEVGIVAAKSKACKTHTAAALAIAAATGAEFLDHFTVVEKVNVGIVSAESGKAALKEMGNRIAASAGYDLADITNLFWKTVVPRLPIDAPAIERYIVRRSLGLLILDPAYFMLRDVGGDMANAVLVGAALEHLSTISHRTGCTIVVVAHNRKGRASDQKRFDPPELDEVAGAGYDQWARFWLLLGPRQKWDGDVGQHWLWLQTGGSAGFGNLFTFDVFEGKRTDEGGRVWQPTIATAAEERKQREAEKEQVEAERHQRTIDGNVLKLRKALAKFPGGETERTIRERAGLNGEAFGEAIEVLIGRGEAEACEVLKRKQTYSGYRPRDPWAVTGTLGLTGTKSPDCPGSPGIG